LRSQIFFIHITICNKTNLADYSIDGEQFIDQFLQPTASHKHRPILNAYFIALHHIVSPYPATNRGQ